jgi:hypothetical protein
MDGDIVFDMVINYKLTYLPLKCARCFGFFKIVCMLSWARVMKGWLFYY